MAMRGAATINLEEGWGKIKGEAIDVLEAMLEGGIDKHTKHFPPAVFAPIFTVCYNMSTQRAPNNFAEQLYQRHGVTMHNYLIHKVLPSLKTFRDEYLLVEFVKRWNNHKIMNKWYYYIYICIDAMCTYVNCMFM